MAPGRDTSASMPLTSLRAGSSSTDRLKSARLSRMPRAPRHSVLGSMRSGRLCSFPTERDLCGAPGDGRPYRDVDLSEGSGQCLNPPLIMPSPACSGNESTNCRCMIVALINITSRVCQGLLRKSQFGSDSQHRHHSARIEGASTREAFTVAKQSVDVQMCGVLGHVW